MRVVTVGNRPPDPSAGGYEVVWDGLVRALRAAGHEVEALHPPALPSAWAHGRWVRREPLRFRRRSHGALGRAQRGADLVVWLNLGGLAMSLVDEARGIPQLGVVHDGWMVHGPRRDPWPRARIRDGGGLWTFNSEFTRRRTLEHVALARTAVVRPGVDLARFGPAPPRAAWEGRLALVGRIAPEKGVDVAVAALDGLPGATLTLTGPGDAPRHPRVVAGGPASRDEVPAAYAAADAVVFPVTWPEPFGLVPLEAMAVGRPVIATGTGGSAEYLRHGENCLLVPPGDHVALAAAVRRLAGEPRLRDLLVAGGRATAAAHDERSFLGRMVELAEEEAAR
jgi:glycogen synthase